MRIDTRLPRLSALVATVIAIGFLSSAGSAAALDTQHLNRFTDDDGNVHEGYIAAIAAVGIARGCNPPANTLYCPRSNLTRGQMAAVLNRALDIEQVSTSSFVDVDGSIFETDIAAIAEAGITLGCNPPLNTKYCPQAPVTRGQFAAFLDRAFDLPDSGAEDWFDDDNGSIFEPQINRLRAAGISNGCNPPENTRFCPSAPVRRDEMASLLARALRLPPILPPPPAAVFIGAGDIGSGSSDALDTAALVAGFPEATVFTTGDNAYPAGTFTDFEERYDPAWGPFKDRTRPSIGNHDARTHLAVPYFTYFGANAGTAGEGWYSYDLGDWHVLVLNSECGDAGLASCQDQLSWLAEDLAANPQACSLAYWHRPLYSSGSYAPGSDKMRDAWVLLDAAGVDVVLNGHEHNYQRYAPQDATGTATATGIREFVVGTGGAALYDLTTELPNLDTSYVGHGVLKFELRTSDYSWVFLPTSGTFTDVGTSPCR